MNSIKSESKYFKSSWRSLITPFKPAASNRIQHLTNDLELNKLKYIDSVDYLEEPVEFVELNMSSTRAETNNEDLPNLIENLPVEILCHIFSYLSFYHRKNASMCCKKWRYVFLETDFLKKISIKANNNLFTSQRPVSKRTESSQAPKHRASSAMALSSYSVTSLSKFNLFLYNNAINLEFENDSADVALFLRNLGKCYLIVKMFKEHT